MLDEMSHQNASKFGIRKTLLHFSFHATLSFCSNKCPGLIQYSLGEEINQLAQQSKKNLIGVFLLWHFIKNFNRTFHQAF